MEKYFHPLQSSEDLDPLIDRIGDSNYVLLGEASHGTHEYYTWRAKISKRLIEEKGFSFIAVEGDWPDCYHINRWVKNIDNSNDSIQKVLSKFKRWPTWMWANWETAAFTQWLKKHNERLTDDQKIGFYGLDVYSLWDSLDIMVKYLQKEDPETAKLAREAFHCFEPYIENEAYHRIFRNSPEGCKKEVINLLKKVRKKAHTYDTEQEADLNAEINALVMVNAEKYYKAMVGFGEDSWNVRDRHMVQTLNTLMDYHRPNAKVIVWEHNTHIGDARATDMTASGLVNVGQLVREQHKSEDVVLVGFGSYEGSVIAGSSWEAPMQKMKVPKGVEGSLEHKLHKISPRDKLIVFNEDKELKKAFSYRQGHRAIGVVYHPQREKGNYVPSEVSSRYDAFLYIDKTKALHPLNIQPNGKLTPETYPFGI
ncbi:Erythromycin esterase homolog [Salegentibacter echinorum]|uniref:Erythromycin esterase homolog n=1 Tax=Salegentibacter echinorum TaxID=1073325 RepID=A0A1M5KBD7_SALEC|nr:erythromycin esterase family protein [Salegentibacter echinorum]SHG50234.1 Erythromycin esterase homolog [Salegentibacter echinorum]